MRADRLLELLFLLQERGRTTAADLAERLEVSVRTIYRDVEALCAAGVPVTTEAGTGGGIDLLPGYRSPLPGLTQEEAAAFLALGMPEPMRELGLGAAWQGAERRVRRAAGLAPDAAPKLFHLDVPRWFRAREPVPHLAALADAVRGSQRVAVRYGPATRRSSRRRILDPLGLVNKAGVWYLVARTATGRLASFRVGRVVTVEPLAERFERPDDFDLVDHWQRTTAEFTASRPRLEVLVRASPQALAVLPEVFGDEVQHAVAAAGPPAVDGRRELILTFEHEEAAAFQLAGFGDLVEVIRPLAVRRLVIERARGALHRHGA